MSPDTGWHSSLWDGAPFGGAKIALICESHVLTYRRDDKPGIPFPGRWDLPGGGREGDETPIACALRELEEEFALVLTPDRVRWAQHYPPTEAGASASYFFVAPVTREELSAVRFGSEGECWRVMPIVTFLSHPHAVTHLQARLSAYLAAETPSLNA